jgi:hypothetical protein
MSTPKITPLPSDAIKELDRQLGKLFLIWELFQIPEFVTLCLQAFDRQKRVMDALLPTLLPCLERMSPEGRGPSLRWQLAMKHGSYMIRQQ